MQTAERDLYAILNRLFAAFPLHGSCSEAREQRKQQFHLYHDRLRELPVALVDTTVLELIDTATYLPRIGTIRARVQARIKHRVNLAAQSVPRHDGDRACTVRPLAETPPVAKPSPATRDQAATVTGPCPRIRDVNGARHPCDRPYEYTTGQARWLRSQGEQLLCTRCAGEYLAQQGELRRQEAIWAERLLASLSPERHPSPDEVKRIHQYGFGQQLHERLVTLGIHSNRRQQP